MARLPDGTLTECDERLRSVGVVEIEPEKVCVKMAQVFKVAREIVVEVETYDRADLLDRMENGELTGPMFDDPRWKTEWDLQNEEVNEELGQAT